MKHFFLLLIIFTGNLLSAQDSPFVSKPEQLQDTTFAEWITLDEIQGNEYGVYYFRKSFTLEKKPNKFVLHVSADNRYNLYVNGQKVCWGPAVGDLNNWNYETIDIAKYLSDGKNLIAAKVWNMGPFKGARQISHTTAFILKGNTKKEQMVNSDRSWKVIKDNSYFPIMHSASQAGGGYIAGCTDSLNAFLHPWGWNVIEFDDYNWKHAKEIGKGNHSGLNTWLGTPWLLKERTIPFMEQFVEPTPDIVQMTGIYFNPDRSSGKLNFTVPTNTKAEILLDNKQLTMGFPQITISGGKGAKIKIQYQEALFDNESQKGNRNEWKNKTMKGYYDIFLCDGAKNRRFEPLWIRTFRYVK
ncbi:MAG: family 78 glycoside hydrolase catalytic domain, partial [Bacteroidales bacterium]|nr:family 78 glycoside hydrolase catalytic domain [Bacteroidales bacterium]